MDELLLRAVRVLLEATSQVTGRDFVRGLVRGLATALDVKAAFVGTLTADGRAVQTRAVWWDGAFIDDFRYDLAGTPCEQVIGRACCFYPERVQQLFPDDQMLVERGIESYYGIPVHGADGTPLGILAALHDQRSPRFLGPEQAALEPIFRLFADRAGVEFERLVADERLAASEARYRKIVSSTHDGVWIVDGAGVTTFVNEQLATMLGWTAAEMVGRPVHEFMEPERRAQSDANRARRARGISERYEFCFRRKDGTELWTMMSTSPLRDDAGAYLGSLALVADLSEVRMLEQKVTQSQKLESLGVLAGGIAHDFNNLLVGILGNVGIALAELPTSSVRGVLLDAELAARRAAELTRQMLAYSGRGRFVVARVSLNGVVEELGQLLASVISKRAQLRLALAPESPLVEGDATQLRQIVMNLITNASDALDGRDGVITIATGTIEADDALLASTYLDDGLAPGTYAYLDVTDTGTGMDAATQARIFDPFFTTKFTGRGLGLAAVLGILRGHHGAVKIETELGRGTTFRVLLPRAATAAVAVVPMAAAPARAARAKVVLVADDEPLVLNVTVRVLQAHGCRVLAARDGTEALALFVAHVAEIDVVVLDLTMPGMSGDEVFREIRQRRADARIVLTSGYDPASVKGLVGADTRATFLAKPWSADALIALVDAADEAQDDVVLDGSVPRGVGAPTSAVPATGPAR